MATAGLLGPDLVQLPSWFSDFIEKLVLPQFKGHQESVHQGKRRKKLPCQLCDRLFTTRSCLNQHIKKIHLSANGVGVKSTEATNGMNGYTDGDKKDTNGATNDISHMVKKRKKSDPA